MTSSDLAAIVLAAGKGTRMKSALPKVMHALAGRPMIGHVLDAVASLGAARAVVVIGPDMPDMAKVVAPAATAVQERQLGTADAVKAARAEIDGFSGTAFVLFGDTPLLTRATLEAMRAAHRIAGGILALGFRPAEPAAYGRLVLGEDGTVAAIVEAKDASPEQLRIGLCNSGVMAVDVPLLFDLVDSVGNENAKGEYYLTDIVGLARARGVPTRHIEAPEAELLGVNDRIDLARAEAVLQERLRRAAMARGVTMVDPASVTLSWDTEFGSDVTVEPNVFFGPGVRVHEGAEIRAYSHIEGAEIGPGARVGPFARLRPGTRLEAQVHVGNFVEMKNAHLGPGAKANHLSYVGDAEVGGKVNIGAGTITCNYDGFFKSRTVIGEGAFIGSNTALVAPVRVGRGAIVGAGSTIARDVAADALAFTRAEHREIAGGGRRYREKKSAEKTGKAAKAAKAEPKAAGAAGTFALREASQGTAKKAAGKG